MATDRYIVAFSATGISDVTGAFDKLNRTVTSTRDVMALARNALVGLAAIQALGGITDLIDAFTNMQNKLKLVTNGTDQVNAVMAGLVNVSKDTRTNLEDTTNLFFRLTRATGDQKLSFAQLLDITKGISQAIKIAGATTDEARNAVVQLGQGLAFGTLRGQDLRSVLEFVPPLGDAIAKKFGLAGGQLYAFATANKGIITSKLAIQAVQDALSEFNSQFQKTTPTIADGFTKFHNALILFLGGLNQSIGIGKTFNELVDVTINHLTELAFILLAIGSIAVFNFITSQLVTFGATLGSFLAFASSGFINLAKVIAYPAQAVYGLGAAFIALSGTVGSVIQTVAVGGFRAFVAVLGGAVSVIAAVSTGVIQLGAMLVRGAVAAATLAVQIARGTISLVAFGAQAAVAFGRFVVTSAIQGVSLLIDGIALLSRGVVQLGIAFITNPFFLGAVVIIGAIAAAWILFKDQILAIIPSFDQVKKAFNEVVAVGMAVVQTLIDDWKLLPDALADLTIQAVNGVIAKLESFVNYSAGLLNHLLPKSLEIPKIDVNDSTIDNAFAGSADKVANTFNQHLEENLKTDWGSKIVDTAKNVVTTVQGYLNPTSNLDLSKLFPSNVASGGITQKIDDLKGRLRSLLESISPLITAELKLKDAHDAVAKGSQYLKDAGISADEVMKRVTRSVIGLGNAETDAQEKLKLLNDAFAKGYVTVDEYTREVDKLKESILDLDKLNPLAGFESAILKLKDDFTDVNKQIQDATSSAFNGLTDQLTDFVVKGKADFASLAESIESDLVKIAIKSAIEAPFLNAISGLTGSNTNSTGSFFGDLFSSQSSGSKSAIGDIGSLFTSGGGGGGLGGSGAGAGGGWLSSIGSWIGSAFADGGEFQVGGQGGTDSQLVAFRASPDETVSVKKPGQGQQSMQQTSVQVHVYGVQDADSFMRSRSQVEAAVGVGINRSLQRNTQAKSKQSRQ